MSVIDKDEKYDRQLRLWASQGQSSLEKSHVLIIEPTITTLELLKNLILPGIGKYTLLDTQAAIDEDDLSNNFYLVDEDLGNDKLQTFAENLNELNNDVESQYINIKDISVLDYLKAQTSAFWSQFSLVVINWNYEPIIDVTNALNIPLIVLNSIGYYGFLRIYKPTFEVFETHPQSLVDLRITEPWKELYDYSNSIDLDSLDIENHSQIPYLIIQLKAIQNWLTKHENIPSNSKEKTELKSFIQSQKKEYNELNFDEAIENSHKIYNRVKVPSNILDIFDKIDDFYNDDYKRNEFWILVKTLKIFVERTDGFLPLSGVLPDMDSNTENYRTLTNIYAAKAQKDLKDFTTYLAEVVSDLPQKYQDKYVFSKDLIKSFVKHSKHLYFSINSKNQLHDTNFKHVIGSDLTNVSNSIVLAFLIVEEFFKKQNNFPSLQLHFNELSDHAKNYTIESEENDTVFQDVLYELIRGDGKQLNNTASVLGGIGGQEAIKLITSQYIPLDNFLIFDGIRSVTERWKV